MSNKSKKKFIKRKDISLEILREIWILYALLDCENWSNKDILSVWYLMVKTYNITSGAGLTDILVQDLIDTNKLLLKKELYKNYGDYIDPISYNNELIVLIEGTPEKIRKKINKEIVEASNWGEFNNKNVELKPKPYKEFYDGSLKGKVNSILNNLFNLKIVGREVQNKTNGVLFYWLDTNRFETLYYILKVFNNNELPSDLKKQILITFLNSTFAEKIIDERLTDHIRSELALTLNDDENEFLKFLLRNSPTVLYNSLKKIKLKDLVENNSDNKEITRYLNYEELYPGDSKIATYNFLKDIKFWAYEDIRNDIPISQFGLDFEISLIIKQANGKSVLEHQSPSKIKNREDSKFIEVSERAYKEGFRSACHATALDLPDNFRLFNSYKPVKLRRMEEKELPEILEQYERMGYHSASSIARVIKAVTDTVYKDTDDLTPFYKHDGEKIDEFLWVTCPRFGITPF